tara:strand:+ start:104 stop:523 length:420 start_codon:yes stop_codon:yes gene_type:complete
MQGRRAKGPKTDEKNPRTSEKVRGSKGPSVRNFGPTIDVVLEVVELVVAVNIHPRLTLLYSTPGPSIAKCLFEWSKFVVWNFWNFRFHFVLLLLIETLLYHVSHKCQILDFWAFFAVCNARVASVMQGRQAGIRKAPTP